MWTECIGNTLGAMILKRAFDTLHSIDSSLAVRTDAILSKSCNSMEKMRAKLILLRYKQLN